MKLKGFTLAELMSTLAIVGLLAALTIPVIVHNIEEHRQRAMVQKGIQTLNEAIAINIAKGRGDLYTYVNRPRHAAGIPGYLVQGIDTATDMKFIKGANLWLEDAPYFETKDGIRFISIIHPDDFDPNTAELIVENINGGQCGTQNIPGTNTAGIINEHLPCPILIDISRKPFTDYDINNIPALGHNIDEGNFDCVEPCNQPGVNGLYMVYLTNNSVYVPRVLREFLDNKN